MKKNDKKRGRPVTIPEEIRADLITAKYRETHCNVKQTCEALGISRQCFYNYVEQDEVLRNAVYDEQDELIDWAESQAKELAKAGNVEMIKFILSHHRAAKRRGWNDNSQNTNVNINNVNIDLTAVGGDDE